MVMGERYYPFATRIFKKFNNKRKVRTLAVALSGNKLKMLLKGCAFKTKIKALKKC
jgi:hypothetical protein